DLAHIDVIVKTVRMSRLVIASNAACLALRHLLRDNIQIAVQPIDGLITNFEPSTTIDPRSPTTIIGNDILSMAIIQFGGKLPQRRNRRAILGRVVDSNIKIRIGIHIAACPRATEYHRLNALNSAEPG